MKLPSDIEVEKAILGSALISGEYVPQILELSSDDFFLPEHKRMFSTIKDYYEDGKPIDPVTLSVSGVDSIAYVGLATHDVAGYCSILREKTKMRQIITVCNSAVARAMEGSFSTDEIITQLDKLSQDVVDDKSTKDITSSLMQVVQRIDDIRTGKRKLGITVGLDFEDSIGGFEDGNFYVVAARPAMGKSAFALEIARRTASHGVPVGILSLEMSDTSLALRLLTADVGIDASDIREGRISDDQMMQIMESADRLSRLPIFFDDNSYVTPATLRSRAHRMKSLYGIGMLVVDYIQLMTGNNDNRERDIAEASRTCKIIAKELGIPVIGLAQLNRGVEQRMDKRPMLSDLRESGAIEQDADAVLMLYRPEYYDQHVYGDKDPQDWRGQTTQNICEVLITKNRNGDVGMIRQVFVKNLMQFKNRSSIY